MPQAKSFVDALQKVLSDLGAAEALPDAVPEVVDGIRQQALAFLQPTLAQQGGMGPEPMDSIGAGMPGQAPGPQMMAAAPTRLPRPAPGSGLPDAATIERFLAGTQSQNGATVGP